MIVSREPVASKWLGNFNYFEETSHSLTSHHQWLSVERKICLVGTEPNQTCPTCKSARFNMLKLGRQHIRAAPGWSKPMPSARQIGRKDVDGQTCSRALESKTHTTSPRGNEITREEQSCRKARGDRQRPM